MKIINHNQLRKQREACQNLEPFIPSNDGFVMTKDERLAFRLVSGSEAATYDKQSMTTKEAFAFLSRLAQMPDVEQAALTLQLLATRMRLLLRNAQNEKVLSSKLTVDIARILNETERYL